MNLSFIAASLFAIAAGQDTCINGPNSACVAGDDVLNEDGVSLMQTRLQVTTDKVESGASGSVDVNKVYVPDVDNANIEQDLHEMPGFTWPGSKKYSSTTTPTGVPSTFPGGTAVDQPTLPVVPTPPVVQPTPPVVQPTPPVVPRPPVVQPTPPVVQATLPVVPTPPGPKPVPTPPGPKPVPKGSETSDSDSKVPPPSPTLQCVINLTMQYFILYTMLQILRTVNQFSGNTLLGWQKILETGCTTVTYAPSLCCLFLGCRMRAIQLTQGNTEKYELPQPWVQYAMYSCSYAVLAQVVLVLSVSFFTGEAEVSTDADGNLDTSAMGGGGLIVTILSLVRYSVMACLYGGFITVCVGIYLMEGPKEIWGKDAPPVSPAVACTICLCTQFFCVYLLVALVKTATEISGSSPFLTKLQGLLSLAKYTQNFVPMLSILFIGARMRALQMDPKNGAPQWWAQNCFYGCTFSVLFQTVLIILMPFCTKCECKQGAVEGDCIFNMENWMIGLMMTVFRYMAILALYGGFSAVCVSVFIIEHPVDKSLTPPISASMSCVMNLTVQYFSVYLLLFIFISVKQFSNSAGGLIDTLIYCFEGAQKTIMFAPMLAILFVGCRMRALQLIMGDNESGVIPPGAGPQSWAQDAMFLATWSLHVQLIMTVLVPLITGAAKLEMDESGNVKAPAGSSKIIGIVFDIIRYLCLLSMYGGAVTIMVAVYYMDPDTLPPNDAGPLIPGLKVPKPPSAPTPNF